MNQFSNFFKSLPTESTQVDEVKNEDKPTEEKKEVENKSVTDVLETNPEKGSSINDFIQGGSEESEENAKESTSETHDEKTGEFTITPFLAKLIESGEFTEEELNEKFEDSIEGLEQIIQLRDSKKEKELEAKAFANLSDDAKRIIELDREGVDIRSILEFESEEIDYASIDLEDVENQQDLYFNYLIETGLSEEKAAKKVNASLELGDLAEDAKDAADFLSKKQNTAKEELIKTQKVQAKAQAEADKAKYEAWVKDVSETKQIKGFDLSKTDSANLLEFMTKPVDKSGKTKEQLAWEDPETRKAFAYFSMKKFDFKAVEKKAETKATIKMKAKVANMSDKGLSTKGTKTQEEEHYTPTDSRNYFRKS